MNNKELAKGLAHYAEIPPFVAFGYEPKTTFWGDFGVADDYHESEDGVRDTFKRTFNEFKDDKVYGTELAMVLNHKAWQHADTNRELSVLYTELFHKLDTYILDNWNKEDLKYYLEITD